MHQQVVYLRQYKREPMEPTTGAAGAAAYKIGLAQWALIATGTLMSFCFVAAFAKPKSSREWFFAMFGAGVGSLFGAPALIATLEIQHWVAEPFGMTAIGGVFFLCGAPGFVLVRAFWHWAEISKDKTLLEIWQEIRGKK